MGGGRQTRFWLLLLAALVLFLWLLSDVLLPFVLGAAIGYFLDPVVNRLERAGLSRAVTAGLLIAGSFAVGLVAIVLLAPLVVEQAAGLVQRVPEWVAAAGALAQPVFARALAGMDAGEPEALARPVAAAMQHVAGMTGDLARRLLASGLALLNIVTLLAITPLVAFYLLRDWPRVIAAIDDWLPRAHAPTIRAQAREVDRVLAAFARGQASVCLVLALFYAVALTVVGLDFGLVIGLTAGVVSFIPYVGTAIGLVSSVGVATVQFWPHWGRIAIVLGIFVGGQVVSDYVLLPRLVGDRVGLHPLWVIFGLFAGGALFGFVGMLIAVPACAVIGVLARFAIGRYKGSTLYLGVA
jgi:predicted PurR-regulated permease PerM